MSRFIITCGSTGGHLSPGIALAEGLSARGHECRLLISRKEIDGRLSTGYPELSFERVPGTGFGWRPVALLRCVRSQIRAFFHCLRLLREVRPDAIVAFGGFTSVPPILAGWLLGIPGALHEGNRIPGLAVRLLGRFCRRVYLPPGLRLASVGSATTRHVGLPVRREIRRRPMAAARASLGLDPNHRVLVVLGGSQGAAALNEWARASLPSLAAAGIQVYCLTGPGKGREGRVNLHTETGVPIDALFTPFSDRMADILSAADLVVARAGAGTLAELVRCGTPAVLVPYPKAKDDHQSANAEDFARHGGGLVVPQAELGRLATVVQETIANDWLLRRCRENLRRMERANLLELILDDLEEIVIEHGASRRRAPQPVA